MKQMTVLSSIVVAALLFVSCSDTEGKMIDESTADISGVYYFVTHDDDGSVLNGCTGSFTHLEGKAYGSQSFTSCTCDGPALEISQSEEQFTIATRNCFCDDGSSYQMTGGGMVFDREFAGERVYAYSDQWTRTDIFEGTASDSDLFVRVGRHEWSYRGESRGGCSIEPPRRLTYTRADARRASASESVVLPSVKSSKP